MMHGRFWNFCAFFYIVFCVVLWPWNIEASGVFVCVVVVVLVVVVVVIVVVGLRIVCLFVVWLCFCIYVGSNLSSLSLSFPCDSFPDLIVTCEVKEVAGTINHVVGCGCGGDCGSSGGGGGGGGGGGD